MAKIMKPEKPFFIKTPFGRVFWSMAVLAIVVFFNTNYMPYYLGRLIVGPLGLNPAAVPIDQIRLIGNILLFIIFTIVRSKLTWEKINAKY